ncbi:hypothetical protein ACL9RL_09265 [Plantibacter sp. Mn2098]|uniref:hypothetical protein n=1 Tax=Plantibacter sp. Mn2098 TaxID=3395266 RepID=UPI003BE93D8F
MSKHAAPRIWFENQRVIRTFLQTVAGTLAGVATFVGILAAFAPQFLEAIREILPEDWYAGGLLVVAFIGTLAAVLAKVMALPLVNTFLTKFGAGSVPKSKVGLVLAVEQAQREEHADEQARQARGDLL